ncbi:MAG: hypothetical protein ACE5HT_07955 [Gemmatimonadales bacterium]
MTRLLKNVFAWFGVALATLVMAGIGVWHYRERIDDAYHSMERRGKPKTAAIASSVGYYSRRHLAAALEKEGSIAQPQGPDFVVLSAAEMASIIRDRLDPGARLVLDSIGVELRPDTLTLHAVLLTRRFGGDLLGPLRGMLRSREPIQLSGVPTMREPGVIDWKIDAFVVRSFPFPRAAVPLLVNHLTGSSDGVIVITVPPSVRRLGIRPDGITFSRRAR